MSFNCKLYSLSSERIIGIERGGARVESTSLHDAGKSVKNMMGTIFLSSLNLDRIKFRYIPHQCNNNFTMKGNNPYHFIWKLVEVGILGISWLPASVSSSIFNHARQRHAQQNDRENSLLHLSSSTPK